MQKADTKFTVLSLVSIGITLVAAVSERYRALIISAFFLCLVVYLIYGLFAQENKNTTMIRRIKEKLNIHEQLIDIKADLKQLRKEISRK